MQLIVLIALATILGAYVGKNPEALGELYQQLIKWAAVLSSPFWLGAGFWGVVACFLLYQSFFVAVRNISEGKDVWFIDQETWLGEQVVKYLGDIGGKLLFFIEILFAIFLLIV